MKSKLLGGRYRVLEILAAGGFSQTYIAEDIHRPSKPKCVVKHLVPPSSESRFLQNARRLFQTEAETLEKLGNNERIPRLLAHFEENREFYLVQEFIPGHPLSAELPPGGRWNEPQVGQLLQEVLIILEFVHSHGLIHRDVKPSNLIRCQQDNRLVLIDFGSVKQIWTQAIAANIGIPTTIAIGTPGYIPTEQGRGKPRPNSDLYALGMIGIQALTGLHPTQLQEESETGEIVWQHHAQVSNGLALILSKMVRYHFKQRYQTATEVLQALQMLDTPDSTMQMNYEIALPARLFSTSQTHVVSAAVRKSSASLVNSPAISPAAISTKRLRLSNATSVSSPLSQFFLPLAPQAPPGDRDAIPNTKTSKSSITQLALPASNPSPFSSRSQPQMLIAAGITAVMLTIVAGYTIYWQPRSKTSPTLEQIENLKAAGKYEQCIAQAIPVLQNSNLYSNAQSLLHECQLAKAQQLAAQKNFPAAISEASKLPPSASMHENAQQLIDRWSNSILELATDRYQSGKLNNAIAMTEAIPETSAVYQKAQAAVKQWHEEWERNNSYLQAAQNALNAAKWQQAIGNAKQVRDTPYWQQQKKAILQQAEAKVAAATSANTSQPQNTRATKESSRTAPKRVIRTANPRGLARTTPKRVVPTATTRRQNQPTPGARSPEWMVENR